MTPEENKPVLTLLESAEVAMVTFGGKQVWISPPEDFYGTDILTTNEAFTVMRAGLNWYIFPTAKIKIHGPFMERK